MEIIKTAAGLMELAARTAPKAKGDDYVVIRVIEGGELDSIADAMLKYAEEKNSPGFVRDGENVRNSEAMILIGLRNAAPVGLNCGACGVDACIEMEKKQREGAEFFGPICAWRVIDLGIALGSAAKTAGILNVDNRIMYRPGVLARKLGLMKAEIVVGIPLSASGKNIYYDR